MDSTTLLGFKRKVGNIVLWGIDRSVFCVQFAVLCLAFNKCPSLNDVHCLTDEPFEKWPCYYPITLIPK